MKCCFIENGIACNNEATVRLEPNGTKYLYTISCPEHIDALKLEGDKIIPLEDDNETDQDTHSTSSQRV